MCSTKALKVIEELHIALKCVPCYSCGVIQKAHIYEIELLGRIDGKNILVHLIHVMWKNIKYKMKQK